MGVSRRDFLKYCGLSAAVLGLSSTELGRLESVLANTGGPTVLWLQGASCTGCSMSFLNFVSTASPTSAADILINKINLAYHPNIMAAAGQTAAEVAKAAYDQGGYILAVEGGVPTAFKGAACYAWTYNNVDVTFQQVVKDMASRAAKILSIGNCAAWGCIPAAAPNPAKIKGVNTVTRQPTINIAGCPPHPDWIVHCVAQLLLGNDIPLDKNSRPTALFNRTVHSQCPRQNTETCLSSKGCRGPATYANCPSILWNNGTNWCVNANAPCISCTEPGFPGNTPFVTALYNPHGGTNLNCNSCHDDEGGGGGGGGGQGPHSAAFIEANQGNCNSCH